MKTRKEVDGIRLLFLGLTATLMICVYMGVGFFDRSGWDITAEGSAYYLNTHGDAMTGWQEIDGKEYYFSPANNGTMATGWLELAGEKYFLDAEGQKSVGWLNFEDKLFYFNEAGCMMTGWVETADGKYYLDADGTAYSGWLCDEGARYYLENGVPHTGWLEENTNVYYFDTEGKLHTGWLDLDGDRYYFREDGTMVVGEAEIDGVKRYFTSQGKLFVLVNRWNPVPEDYTVTFKEIDGFKMAEESCEPLAALIAACNEAGYPCKIRNGYRSFNFQTTVFNRKVDRLMAEGYTRTAAEWETSYSIAIPGTSEHQLGLAVDLTCGQSAYEWLRQHSWEYGFIMRYPFGKTAVTGIYYEPWHYRYVGLDLAKELFELDVCVEEYFAHLTEKNT